MKRTVAHWTTRQLDVVISSVGKGYNNNEAAFTSSAAPNETWSAVKWTILALPAWGLSMPWCETVVLRGLLAM